MKRINILLGMTEIISIANQKGGVGKTTTALCLSYCSALAGKKTILIDCDSQGNASSVLLPNYEGLPFFENASPQPSRIDNLYAGYGDHSLAEQEQLLSSHPHGIDNIVACVEKLKEKFDIIILDCPPSLANIPTSMLSISDRIIIPLQCEYYAMEGLSQIISHLGDIFENRTMPVVKILLTMYDKKLPLCTSVKEEIEKHFENDCLKAIIPRDINLASAPSYAKVIFETNPLSDGALCYLEACKEILDGI